MDKILNNGWVDEGDFIDKTYEFEDFTEAIAFINGIAKIAEEMSHHPDLVLHDYKYVTVTTYTHSTGTITEKDVTLATKVDELYG